MNNTVCTLWLCCHLEATTPNYTKPKQTFTQHWLPWCSILLLCAHLFRETEKAEAGFVQRSRHKQMAIRQSSVSVDTLRHGEDYMLGVMRREETGR